MHLHNAKSKVALGAPALIFQAVIWEKWPAINFALRGLEQIPPTRTMSFSG